MAQPYRSSPALIGNDFAEKEKIISRGWRRRWRRVKRRRSDSRRRSSPPVVGKRRFRSDTWSRSKRGSHARNARAPLSLNGESRRSYEWMNYIWCYTQELHQKWNGRTEASAISYWLTYFNNISVTMCDVQWPPPKKRNRTTEITTTIQQQQQ